MSDAAAPESVEASTTAADAATPAPAADDVHAADPESGGDADGGPVGAAPTDGTAGDSPLVADDAAPDEATSGEESDSTQRPAATDDTAEDAESDGVGADHGTGGAVAEGLALDDEPPDGPGAASTHVTRAATRANADAAHGVWCDTGTPRAGRDAPAEEEDTTLVDGGVDIDPSAGVLWMQPWQDLAREVRPLVRGLVAQLRVEDPIAAPRTVRTGGKIDMRSYVRSRGQRPFLRAALPADSPRELAMLLAIDGTGSMGGNPRGATRDNRPLATDEFGAPDHRMPHVRRAALALHLACGELGVPLAIAECCDSWRRCHAPDLPSLVRTPVTWLQRYDTPLAAEGPKALIAGLYGHALAEAVVRSLQITAREMATRPEQTRVLVYVHDGAPVDNTIEAIQAELRRTRKDGIIVLGLYIGEPSGLATMRQIFGATQTIGVERVAALPAHLGAVLKRYRLAG